VVPECEAHRSRFGAEGQAKAAEATEQRAASASAFELQRVYIERASGLAGGATNNTEPAEGERCAVLAVAWAGRRRRHVTGQKVTDGAGRAAVFASATATAAPTTNRTDIIDRRLAAVAAWRSRSSRFVIFAVACEVVRRARASLLACKK